MLPSAQSKSARHRPPFARPPATVPADYAAEDPAAKGAVRDSGQRRAGVQVLQVAYRGGQAVPDLLAGNITGLFLEVSSVLPLHREGKGRILAIASDRRWPLLPDVPTFIEGGVQDFVEGAFATSRHEGARFSIPGRSLALPEAADCAGRRRGGGARHGTRSGARWQRFAEDHSASASEEGDPLLVLPEDTGDAVGQ